MNTTDFQKNFDELKKHYPKVYEQLELNYQDTQYELSLDEGKETTLLVNGRQLTSHHDRKALALYNLSKLNLRTDVTIMGFGLGDEVRELLKQKFKHQINVVLLNPALFLQLLSIDDKLYELFQNNVHFIIPDESYKMPNNFVVLTSEIYLDMKTFNNLKVNLINHLDNAYGQKLFASTAHKYRDINLNENKKFMRDELPLTPEYAHKIIGDKVVICGAGPSLDACKDKLKTLIEKGYKVFSVDSAVIALSKIGVVPDIICTTDYLTYRNLKGFLDPLLDNFKKTTLFYTPHSERVFIDIFPGPKFYTFDQSDRNVIDYLPSKLTNLVSYRGSVSNMAIAIATMSRTKEIAFVGVDFAFFNNVTHAGNLGNAAINRGSMDIEVLCNDGQMRGTQRNFAFYKQDLEDEIARHPEIKYYNYSKTGAVIKGTDFVED